MKRFSILSAAAIAVLAACGGSSKPPTFKQPAGTTAVNFSVDDTANKVYTDSTLPDGGVGPSDLQWKGAMLYDPATNKVSADSSWGGPFAALYDDGPWTAGGHEPEGSSGGDHIFGVTVFVTPPASGSGDTYSYGLNDGSIKLTSTVIDPNGWIWPSSTNGSFTVAPGATAPVKADGVALKKFGTTDVQFSVNTASLAAGAWDTSVISVKSSAWGWSGIKFTSGTTIAMSQIVGTGNPIVHAGLVSTGDKVQFIVVFNGKEYKSGSGNALLQGVTVGTKAAGASTYTNLAISVACDVGSDNKTNCTGTAAGIDKGNSYITIP
ncbi:MAG: hypothetical protein E6J88_05855 [Deltaproteobacteria bacterium]|nr:MAG: hypothetical protein E6J88_05855 [Deltaproteobacteria bacterium]